MMNQQTSDTLKRVMVAIEAAGHLCDGEGIEALSEAWEALCKPFDAPDIPQFWDAMERVERKLEASAQTDTTYRQIQD